MDTRGENFILQEEESYLVRESFVHGGQRTGPDVDTSVHDIAHLEHVCVPWDTGFGVPIVY